MKPLWDIKYQHCGTRYVFYVAEDTEMKARSIALAEA